MCVRTRVHNGRDDGKQSLFAPFPELARLCVHYISESLQPENCPLIAKLLLFGYSCRLTMIEVHLETALNHFQWHSCCHDKQRGEAANEAALAGAGAAPVVQIPEYGLTLLVKDKAQTCG